jgi:hypothetical protein
VCTNVLSLSLSLSLSLFRVKMCSDDLKNHLEGMIDAVFGPVEKRWIDAYFPFTGFFFFSVVGLFLSLVALCLSMRSSEPLRRG